MTRFPISPENVTRTVLDNGLVVLVKDNPSAPAVTVVGRVLAGSIRESARLAGLAGFTAAALGRGTQRFNYRQLNETYDRFGMSFSVGAGLDSAGFAGRSLSEDLDRLIGLAAETLLRPVFPDREIEKLRTQIQADLAESDDDTREVAFKEFRKLCYPAPHPYHRSSEGTKRSIGAITGKDLAQFHERNYKPAGAIVVFVGDVRAEAALAKVAHYFGGWAGAARAAAVIAPPPARSAPVTRHFYLEGKAQSDIVIGYPGLRRADPDYYALSLGDLIFGRLGLYGRLGANIRERQGLAYYVYSSLEAGMGPGPWTVNAGVNPRNVEKACAAILDEIAKLREDGVTVEELAEAQDFLTGYLALQLETNDGVASTLANIEFYRLGLDYIERYNGLVRGIKREQIHAALQRYAHPESAIMLVAGPRPAGAEPGGEGERTPTLEMAG